MSKIKRQNRFLIYLVCFISILYQIGASQNALGLQWTLSSITGLLQQPASHYYHAIYGAQGSLETDSSKLILRLGAFERPVFSGDDYKDQDLGAFGLIGTKVTQTRNHGLYAFLGSGKIYGYTAATSLGFESRRQYELRGAQFAMEYQANFGAFDFCLNHMQFIGSFSNDQLKSFVAWPFSFYLLSLGYRWS